MGRLIRVDAELVRRKLATSRAHASELIASGAVLLDGAPVHKPARQMDRAQALEISKKETIQYVSRGAHKLRGALEYLRAHGYNGPDIGGKICLDAGASTGGFTDVLLRNGAKTVYAVDVGYGQLAWTLRTDERVINIERTNVRTMDPTLFKDPPQIVVGDLSFISLTLIIPALVKAAAAQAEYLLMVKPQFEIGKDRLGKGGVVTNPLDHVQMVEKVANNAIENGLSIIAVAPSPLPGPAGNVEYFLYMRAHNDTECLTGLQLRAACEQSVKAGPAGKKWPADRR